MKNSSTTPIVVLIFEHHLAIPTVMHHLNRITEETGQKFLPYFETNKIDAYERLPHVDLAIIEVEGDGRAIANIAVQSGIPLVTTSLFFGGVKIETPKIKQILKPYYTGLQDSVEKLLAVINSANSCRLEPTASAFAA